MTHSTSNINTPEPIAPRFMQVQWHIPEPSTALSGTAYDRGYAIAQRCGSDPELSRRGDSWTVHCPAHSDGKPSLAITDVGDKVLLHCWAGCAAEAVCAAIGIAMGDLFVSDLPEGRRRVRTAPKPQTGWRPDNVPLLFAITLLLDDPSLLEIQGCRDVLRNALRNPAERLWVEREFARCGMSADAVWQAVAPDLLSVLSVPTPGIFEQLKDHQPTAHSSRRMRRVR